MSRILIVEDEVAIADLEKDYLELSGFEVEIENDGTKGLERALHEESDLFILDLMLPGVDGFEICKKIRETKNTPILMVSAKKDDIDKIRGLGLGADDYVTKPFYMGELLARIRVALRKSNQIPEEKKEKIFQCDYLKVDWEKHQVSIDEKEVHLTPMEYKILKLLIDNRGKVLTHNYILSQIWGSAQGVEAANLRVFMAALRRKIEKDPGNCRFILTEV